MSKPNKKSQKYFIVTFGCQMNKADSERIAAHLEKQGYKEAKDIKKADLIVINTCSVRQRAEDRVIGLIKNLKKLKIASPAPTGAGENCPGETEDSSGSAESPRRNRDRRSRNKLKIILAGCMYHHGLYKLRRLFPEVDEFWPPAKIPFEKASKRKDTQHAWLPIMEGCDNYCTYCIVPYSRGPERSRDFDEVICQAEELVSRGYTQITLLGQNVNSYKKNSKLKVQKAKLQLKIKKLQKKYKNNFAILLAVLQDIKGLKKISFITSNPHDLTDDIIEAMKLPKIDRYLHLPVQSGDDQILKKMNRKYTAADYLARVAKIRKAIPDIQIGTDIIVGFPGETRKQFANTVGLCEKIGFEKAYLAQYSPRPGTAAARLKDNVSPQEKKRRWQVLEDLINN